MKNFKLALYAMCLTITLTAQPGTKLRFTTEVDAITREYYLHIPSTYDGNRSVPLVFMLHGTSGDGERMYESSGWAELAEKEGFIAVFPSSLRYKIIDDGEQKNITKWNTLPDASWTLQPGEKGADDIKFLRKVVSEVVSGYKIDESRIYLNGFSNGGQMAAKCSIEMSDLLAAVCMNAGSFFLDTVYVPKRKLPVLYQVGDMDYGPGNTGAPIPLAYFDSLISTPDLPYFNGKLYKTARNITRNFSLKTEHSVAGDTNFAMIATYLPLNAQDKHELRYVYVNNLAHNYPNWAPAEHWKWMKPFTLDNGTSSGFTLTTDQGYGGGNYSQGDTVHIWSRQNDGKVFTHWSGDISYLESPNEYHSRLVMPAKNISVTAHFTDLQPDMVMNQYSTMGAQRMKRFYAYAPADKSKIKGVAWFFHGANGNALSFISDPDTRQMIHLLMIRDYAVVSFTCEESDTDIDSNNDGVLRWSYGLDSAIVDIANVRAIRDTMIRRGFFPAGTPHVAFGWSAGGAFTEFVANVLGWRAAINHTSSGNEILSRDPTKNVPLLTSINENDDNDGMGPTGNARGRENIQNYLNRGACARLHEQNEAPLFPERFDRSDFITETLSRQIFDEIKGNNALDAGHYLKGTPAQLVAAIAAFPGKFPVIVGLNSQQRDAVKKQLEVTYADHSFKADINDMSLKFIENACGSSTAAEDEKGMEHILIRPNPVSSVLYIEGGTGRWTLTDFYGREAGHGSGNEVHVSGLAPGFYFIRIDGKVFRFVKL